MHVGPVGTPAKQSCVFGWVPDTSAPDLHKFHPISMGSVLFHACFKPTSVARLSKREMELKFTAC